MKPRTSKFRTFDGCELYGEQWGSDDYRGVIVFLHGIGDHSGRYGPFIEYFVQKNFRVSLFDQRGHGRSEGKRVFAKSLDIFCEDLSYFINFTCKNTKRTVPWFLVGHSFGGQIALNFLGSYNHFFTAGCASSPNLQVAITMPRWQQKLGRMLIPLWPTMKIKGSTDPKHLSHDETVVQNYVNDPLVSPYVRTGIGLEILQNLPTVFHLAKKIQAPLLLLHGSEDRYCAPDGTRRFFNELVLAQKELKIYDGLYHELLNEVHKEVVFEDIARWFEKFI